MASVAVDRSPRRADHSVRHHPAGRCSWWCPSVRANAGANRAVIPGTGRTLEWATPSPPPEFNFAVLPNRLRRGDPLLGHEAHARSAEACFPGARAVLRGDRDAAQQPDGIHYGLLCGRHGLFIDLAHLVARGAGFGIGAYATFVVFAWRDVDRRLTYPSTKSLGSIAPIVLSAAGTCMQEIGT
jgi:hypothetical protein